MKILYNYCLAGQQPAAPNGTAFAGKAEQAAAKSHAEQLTLGMAGIVSPVWRPASRPAVPTKWLGRRTVTFLLCAQTTENWGSISGVYAAGLYCSCANFSNIAGGYCNTVSANYSSILGGQKNTVCHDFAGVFGCNITTVASCAFHVNCLVAGNTHCWTGTGSLASGAIFKCASGALPAGALPLYIMP